MEEIAKLKITLEDLKIEAKNKGNLNLINIYIQICENTLNTREARNLELIISNIKLAIKEIQE